MKVRTSDGFTLAEMLVSLAIVALVSAAMLSMPFAIKREAPLDLVARQVAAKLNAAAATATRNGTAVEVDIDVDRHTISASGTSIQIPAALDMGLKTGLELLQTAQRGSLVFFADGSSSGGEIALASPRGKSLVIRVNWATGAVGVLRTE